MEQRINEFIETRRAGGLLRSLCDVEPTAGAKVLIGGKEYVNLSSNDYLSIASHPDIVNAMQGAGVPASASSRLMTGTRKEHSLLEEKVAAFKGKEAALIFNSGYQANIGIISALCSRGTAVYCDKLSHASIIDGIKLSGAKMFRFKHNDMDHLEDLLSSGRGNYKNALIITETVFSMDGDTPDLKRITELKDRFDCMLMLDEAHATGIFGKNGSGWAEEADISASVDVLMGTFSKALGGFGAYAATSSSVREYLINTCRSFIYSTSLPVNIVLADSAGLDVVFSEPERRKELLLNSAYMRERLIEKGFRPLGGSQIIPIVVPDNKTTLRLSADLRKKGYWVTAVRPPTVPAGESRIRISLNYDHKRRDIDAFIEALAEVSGDQQW
ncbi:MAG: aminotransferase class I/II-fold pyridoxal phosphate-dependent enzyme [Candidatus Omnitrophica bacterium]|nr:aminotransferase class I/II-fold pyridoxal phosphate-dependent enzyme [Candidatus Omnitrophota bacterium]